VSRILPVAGMRVSRGGALAIAASQAIAGCVCEPGDRSRGSLPGDDPTDPHVEPVPPPAAREAAVWEFSGSRAPPLLSLWPKDPSAPQRKKHHIDSSKVGEALLSVVQGNDPWFLWQFETPLHAAVVALDVTSDKPGNLQLFWTTIDCPTFAERCSQTQSIGGGRQEREFILSFTRAVRELRLDLPQEPGARLELHSLRVYGKRVLKSGVRQKNEHTQLENTAQGLVVVSDAGDPWITLDTPWLDADAVSSIELEMPAPAAARPQLYWQGTACPGYSEACTVPLAPGVTPGAYRAELAGVKGWSGRVRELRLDPSSEPARYVIVRIALIRRK
jgi:hypothetical protein